MDDAGPREITHQDFTSWFGRSVVRNAKGNPLVVYRGEHGRTGQVLKSRLGSLTFGPLEVAAEYAKSPNDRRVNPTAEAPHVIPALLSISNPLVNDPDDAFIDFSRLRGVLGEDRTQRVALALAYAVEETSAWAEEYAGRYASLTDLIEADPESLYNLCVETYRVLDDPVWVGWLQEAGIDGAVHGGSGAGAMTPEYRVFSEDQVRSAIDPSVPFRQAPAVPVLQGNVRQAPSTADYIRNPDGTPRVFYRGESSGVLYTEFDPRMTQEKIGFFFAEGVEHAYRYAENGKVPPRAFHLRSDRLLDLTDPYSPACRSFVRAFRMEYDEWIDRASGETRELESFLEAGDLYAYDGWGAERWKHLFRFAGRNGYDAVRVLDTTDGVPLSTVVVAMEKEQIEFAPSTFTQAPRQESPAFQKWFAGSAIRDASGAPQILYHGTASVFDSFSRRKAQDRLGRSLELGWGRGKFYFTTTGASAGSAATAAAAQGKGEHPHVMPVYVRITRPIAAERYMAQVQKEVARGRTRDAAIALVDQRIRRQGFDGIVDELSGGVAAFEPTQIKSALGNSGLYDRQSPSILTSLQQNPSFSHWFKGSVIVDQGGEPRRLFHATRAPDFDRFRRRRNDLGIHFGTSGQANERLDDLAKPGVELQMGRILPVYLAIRNPLRLPDVGTWTPENLIHHLVRLFPDDRKAIIRATTSSKVRDILAAKGYDGVVYANDGEVEGAKPYRQEKERTWQVLVEKLNREGKPLHSYSSEDQQTPEYRAYSEAQDRYRGFIQANAQDSYIAFWPEQVKSAIGNRGTFSSRSKSILASATKGPEFDRWFGSSKVRDPDGKPRVLYHGTTQDFDTFDESRLHHDSNLGKGFYFSSSPLDVRENYATADGPDLRRKMSDATERRAQALYDEGLVDDYEEEARQQIHSWYVRHEGLTLPVHLRLENPAILGGPGETHLHLDYDSEAEDSEPSGSLLDFLQTLREVSGGYYGGSIDSVIDSVFWEACDRGGSITLHDVIEMIRRDESMLEFHDDDGNVCSMEMVRRSVQQMGYDGFIDRTVSERFKSRMNGLDPTTEHYIVFSNTQIKSALGNRGSYDPVDPNILHSLDEGSLRADLEGSCVVDERGRPKLMFSGDDGGFHGVHEAGRRAFFQDLLPGSVLTPSNPRGVSAPTLSVMRNPLRLDWSDPNGLPQPASVPCQGFLNLHDAIRSARLKGHDGLVVHGLQGKADDGADLGPVSFINFDESQNRSWPEFDDADRPIRALRALLRRAMRDNELVASMGDVGPFDGGCLIAARALILAAGRGELVRIDGRAGPDHYGARIDGNIVDMGGVYTSPDRWIAAFRNQEWAVIGSRELSFSTGWRESEIPDDPERATTLAQHLRRIGITAGAQPTPAERFSEWFGRSKVTTPLGLPKMVFHGSGTPGFEIFDPAQRGSRNPAPDSRMGFFFAENPRSAEQFVWKDGDKSGAIYPVYLRLENPLVIDDFHLHAGSTRLSAERIEQAKAEGHDGVLFRRSDMLGHGGEVYIVFDPTQIKSAIANRGSFSLDDPSILRSASRSVREWIDSSQVKHANGAPMLVYHGTRADRFDVFDTRHEGAHFGTYAQAKRRLAHAPGDGDPRIIASYLSLHNPLDLPDLGVWNSFNALYSHLSRSEVLSSSEADNVWAEWQKSDDAGWVALREQLKAKGFDGFRYQNQVEGRGMSFVAFDATQIRVVCENCTDELQQERGILASRSPAPALLAWAQDTKVVDDLGLPLTVYHGSRSPHLESFDLGMEGTGAVNTSGKKLGGIWFTTSRSNAAFFADQREGVEASPDETFVYGDGPFYAAIADASGEMLFSIGPHESRELAQDAAQASIDRYNADPHRGDAIVAAHLKLTNPLVLEGVIPREAEFAAARAQGHDGIIARNVVDGIEHGDVYVAFRPEQVKSATSNSGMYDPASLNIYASRFRGMVEAAGDTRPRRSSSTLLDIIDRHPQERCSADQWRRLLPGWRGLDLDQLAWSGLDPWLARVQRCAPGSEGLLDEREALTARLHPKGSVGRAELLEFLKQQDTHLHLDPVRSTDTSYRFVLNFTTHAARDRREAHADALWRQFEAHPDFPHYQSPADQIDWVMTEDPQAHQAWRECLMAPLQYRDGEDRSHPGDHLVEMEIVAHRGTVGGLIIESVDAHEVGHGPMQVRDGWVDLGLRQVVRWAAEQAMAAVTVAPDVASRLPGGRGELKAYAAQWGGRMVDRSDGGIEMSIPPAMVQSAKRARPLFQAGDLLSTVATGPVQESDRSTSALISPALKVAEQRLAQQGMHLSLAWADSKHARGLQRIAHTFGRKMVPYRQVAGTDHLNGFVLPDDPNSVYVNLRSPYALRSIIGHEIAHSIFLNDRMGYEHLMQIAKRHHQGPSPLTEETLCDFIGRKFTDARFMLSVEQERPSLFVRMIATLKTVLTKVMAVMHQVPELHQAREIEDCREIRLAAADLLRRHLRHTPSASPHPTVHARAGAEDWLAH